MLIYLACKKAARAVCVPSKYYLCVKAEHDNVMSGIREKISLYYSQDLLYRASGSRAAVPFAYVRPTALKRRGWRTSNLKVYSPQALNMFL